MPTIKDRLQEDWKHSLKSKYKFRTNVVSTARSSMLLIAKLLVWSLRMIKLYRF